MLFAVKIESWNLLLIPDGSHTELIAHFDVFAMRPGYGQELLIHNGKCIRNMFLLREDFNTNSNPVLVIVIMHFKHVRC